MWFVYVIRAGDGSLYTGITTDVQRRFAEHEAGGPRAARFLRGRGPLELVYRCKLGERSLALQVEYGLKRQPRSSKERIVESRMRKRRLLATLGLDSG